MKTILFQGDSITDCDRGNSMGRGYPLIVSAKMGFENPGKYNFINRGVGGNRSIDVYARIKPDIINLKPDYLSLLMGVNDVWRNFDRQSGISAEKYEKIYSMLIEEILEELPNVKIMILEPFCLKGNSTDNTEEYPDKWNLFNNGVKEMAKKAREIAKKYNISFIPLQEKFDSAVSLAEETYWLVDGVHPTPMGHEIIAREWIKTFDSLK